MSAFIEQYNILFKGLKSGKYNFCFRLNNEFFEYYNNPDYPGGSIDVDVELNKKAHLFSMCFTYSGNARVICDLCLEEFDIPLNFNSNLFVKFGEEVQERDADVIYLEFNDHKLNLADYFFESVCLNLPVKRIHRKDVNGKTLCNKEMIKMLDKHLLKQDKKETDPRWNSLKDLISKKN